MAEFGIAISLAWEFGIPISELDGDDANEIAISLKFGRIPITLPNPSAPNHRRHHGLGLQLELLSWSSLEVVHVVAAAVLLASEEADDFVCLAGLKAMPLAEGGVQDELIAAL